MTGLVKLAAPRKLSPCLRRREMPAPHYALSEALIVLVAIWVALRMTRRRAWFGALGVTIFGIAAGIGVVRFSLGQIEELATFHRDFSQVSGATAMALVAIQCLKVPPRFWVGWRLGVAIALTAATLGSVLVVPDATILIFLAWLIVAIIACSTWPAASTKQRLLRAGVVAIFLVNLLLVRQSTLLGIDASWHLYHVLIALWLFGLWWVLAKVSDRPQLTQNNQ